MSFSSSSHDLLLSVDGSHHQPLMSGNMLPYFRSMQKAGQRAFMQLVLDATRPSSDGSCGLGGSAPLDLEGTLTVLQRVLPPSSPHTSRLMLDTARDLLLAEEESSHHKAAPSTSEGSTSVHSSAASAAAAAVQHDTTTTASSSSSSKGGHHHRRGSSGDMGAELDELLLLSGGGGPRDITLISDLESLFLSPGRPAPPPVCNPD